ncbi:hypothetical protein MBANPS3_005644 [Mucor bainieri]
MNDWLTYSKYEQMLCMVFDETKSLKIYRSSNRAISMDYLSRYLGETMGLDTLQLLLENYFDACGKEQNQQSVHEKSLILEVQQYARQSREDLLCDEETMFDKCQFLFCLPLRWAGKNYEGKLRALFVEAGWITQDDPTARLIFSPFTEGLTQYLMTQHGRHLEREAKYLLLSIDKVDIHLATFQMQSAKELIGVSRTLAASDFLLVPTDLGDTVSWNITELNLLMYSSTKMIIIKHFLGIIRKKRYYKREIFKYKNRYKKTAQKQRHNINAATLPWLHAPIIIEAIMNTEDMLYKKLTTVGTYSEYSNQAHSLVDTVVVYIGQSQPLYTCVNGLKRYKEVLKGLTCGAFMNELLTDANVKGFIDQLVCKVKELYSKYSSVPNSPEGIQGVILHCDYWPNVFYSEIIQDALLDAKLVDAKNGFIGTNELNICEGSMQKALKMVQIANALLSPTIRNNAGSKQLELEDYCITEGDLLPPNSFYVQAYINDDHIRFILNKVVAVSTVGGTVQKSVFTIHEMSVKLEDLLDSVCDNMWNHLVSHECQRDPYMLTYCDTHSTGGYSAADYCFSKCSIKKMAEKLTEKLGEKLASTHHQMP